MLHVQALYNVRCVECEHSCFIGDVCLADMFLDAVSTTLVLLLIARTNFSEFSDDWHNR